jgi:hypothetical protein
MTPPYGRVAAPSQRELTPIVYPSCEFVGVVVLIGARIASAGRATVWSDRSPRAVGGREAVTQGAAARRRQWADVVAILAGVSSFGFAIWVAPFAAGEVGGFETQNIKLIWGSYALAGVLAIAAVLVSQRRAGLGRALLAVGGVVLLIGLVGFGRPEGAAWASIIPAILMLAAAPFIGDMPPD